jgi:hypothetical protein
MFKVEIMAIWYDLKLWREHSFRKVLRFPDSLLSVNLIKELRSQNITVSCVSYLFNSSRTESCSLPRVGYCWTELAKLDAIFDSPLYNVSIPPRHDHSVMMLGV